MLSEFVQTIGFEVTKVSASHALFMTQPLVIADTVDKQLKRSL